MSRRRSEVLEQTRPPVRSSSANELIIVLGSIAPRLVTGPTIGLPVPAPVRVALGMIRRPLVNTLVEAKRNTAGLTPSPTTNGVLLDTSADPVSSEPRLNMN